MSNEYQILKDQIVYFPGIIDNHEVLVREIESLDAKAVSPWEIWHAGDNKEHAYGEIKYMNRSFYKDEDPETLERCKFVIETLCDAMAKCARVYGNLFNLSNDHIDFAISVLKQDTTTIGINKYNENAHMGPHVDLNNMNHYIQYTIVVYLNDDYEGGELNFPNHGITLKPVAGSIAMYPSGNPYTHESLNITKGRKMLITHHLRNNEAR